MGFFSSNSKPERQDRPTPSGAISSIIAKEMHITGEITFMGKTRIDGILKGNIKGEYLILSETGQVHGDLTLDTLVCHGSIQGDIEANTITAHKTAAIRGKISSGNLTVEPGASIEGEIYAVTDETLSTPPSHSSEQMEDTSSASPEDQADSSITMNEEESE